MDLLDEVRVTVEQQMTQYQDLMAKHYNAEVKPRHFSIEDLVLRKGTYKIIGCNKKDTYYLETLDRHRLHHPWNTDHLKRYY